MVNSYDVLIVGGSYAGLACALTLGRSLRKVLVMDSGEPCNRYATHAHNFLGADGIPVDELKSNALRNIRNYKTVTLIENTVENCKKTSLGFELSATKGNKYYGKKLVIATGIKDILDDIPGLKECWGISAIHCPYCHGYEYHAQPTGIIIKGASAIHHAELISNWTSALFLFTNGDPELTEERIKSIKALGVELIETPVKELIHDNGKLKCIITADGKEYPMKAVYVSPTTLQASNLAASLGCELNDKGLIETDKEQKTNVEGVYACGDCTANRSLAGAVNSGHIAGGAVNNTLIAEGFFASQSNG